MQEKPKVVVSRTRRVDTAAKEFNFTESEIRAGNDPVASYRNLAWNAFKRLALPVNTEEVSYAEARVARAAREACTTSGKSPVARGDIPCADGLTRP